MQKWNPRTRKYEPYTIPPEWHTPIYCEDMDEVINCARCGTKMPYGDGFTSRHIHTDHGMGYCVCEDCYKKEWSEEVW